MRTTDEIIEYLYPGAKDVNKRRPSAYDMIRLKKEISQILGLPYSSFNEKTHKRDHVRSRQMLAVALKIFTDYSLAKIGVEVSNKGKDHATVLYSIKQIANLHQTEKKFRETFNEVIYATEKLFRKNRFPRPIRKEQGLVSKELWKYAIKLLSEHVNEPKSIPITPFRDRNEIIKLKEILQDKERELRLLRSQIERSRIKNSYEYVD